MKIHLHRFDAETGARHLRLHAQRDSFVRLNPNNEDVLIAFGRFLVEKDMRRFFEMDGNLGPGFRQTFADTQINWHIGETPIVDEEPQRHVRLGH